MPGAVVPRPNEIGGLGLNERSRDNLSHLDGGYAGVGYSEAMRVTGVDGRGSQSITTLKLAAIAIAVLLTAALNSCTCQQQTTPLACNALTTCPADAPLRVCISRCARKAGLNQLCSLDPCEANPTVCDPAAGLTCIPEKQPARTDIRYGGMCKAIGPRSGLAVCDPSDVTHPCGPGYFCLDTTRFQPGSCAPVTPDVGRAIPVSFCAAVMREGQSCDSSLANPGCRACDVGLDCIQGTCRRLCQTDGDCPCGGFACFPLANQNASVCLACAAGGTGTSCVSTTLCCDHSLMCGAQAQCCQPNGTNCNSATDCCGLACIKGKCVTCTPPNQTPTTGDPTQCCPGEDYKSNVCFKPCPLQVGDLCKVSFFNGASVFGQCQFGTVVNCDNFGNIVCQPGKPQPEICNHLDDNCDGLVDNLTGTCATQAPGGCNVTGHNKCGTQNGAYQQTCSITAGVDYCTSCGQVVNGASCGACAGWSCSSEAACVPNALCIGGPPPTCSVQSGCSVSPSSLQCWLPANLCYNRSNGCFAPNPTCGTGGTGTGTSKDGGT